MSWLAEVLRGHPELALFLTLAAGYGLGRLRIASFRPGPVIGVLVASIAVGQLRIPVSQSLKNSMFMLFLFSVGYQSGPQFFAGLKTRGLPQLFLSLVLTGSSLALVLFFARVLGLDSGGAGGLLAGATTVSAALGTVGEAITRLDLDPAAKQALATSATVAFAVTYLFGMVLVVWLLPNLGPRLMGVDLARACRELEQEMGLERREEGVASAYDQFVLRAYAVPPELAGRSVAELERLFAGQRVFIERVRQGGALRDDEPGLVVAAGDHVAVSGSHGAFMDRANPLLAREVDDRRLLDLPMISVDLVVANPELVGRALGEFSAAPLTRGVFLRKLTRGANELPFTAQTRVERGDVLQVTGGPRDVERLAARVGYADWPTPATDMVAVAAAITVGGLIGIPAWRLGGLSLGLSLPVGVLVGGLLLGWLRSVDRRFGGIPAPALWIFDSLGLAVFIALTGLEAGPSFIEGLRSSGIPLIAAGVVVTVVPHLLTILVGRVLLKMHPGILLGVCAGAGTSAPALAALREASGSSVPALGYSVSYAVGSVVLALWGTLLVNVL